MEDALLELYEHFVLAPDLTTPYYTKAQKEWAGAKGGTWLELEDAARCREYEWGCLSFRAGLRLGLELARPEGDVTEGCRRG